MSPLAYVHWYGLWISSFALDFAYSDKHGNWIQAGASVMALAKDHPFIKEHVAWVNASQMNISFQGAISVLRRARAVSEDS